MLVTQIDNRRLRKARLAHERAISYDRIPGQTSTAYFDNILRLSTKFSYLLDQQSARLARFLHRPSFAGVPAAPHAQRRHTFMTKWGDLTDISKLELPYKERRERYVEEMKSNLNSWKGLPPLPHRGPRAKVSKSK